MKNTKTENEKNIDNKDELFLKLLNMFKSKDTYISWMSKPFKIGNKTASTNGYAMIVTPLQKGFEDLSEKIKYVYPMDTILDKKIKVSELKQKLNDFPKVECFGFEEIECDACDGHGEVDYYFSHNFEDFEIVDECPICKGDGIINRMSETAPITKELDYSKFFGIGCHAFNVARIESLIEISEMLNSDEITLVNHTNQNKPSLFRIKEVEVLIMPIMCSDISNIVQKID